MEQSFRRTVEHSKAFDAVMEERWADLHDLLLSPLHPLIAREQPRALWTDLSGASLLHWACTSDDGLPTVQLLLQQGAHVNGYYEDNPLHWAVSGSAPAVCAALLAAGACPNALTRRGRQSPLTLAARSARAVDDPVVALLLACPTTDLSGRSAREWVSPSQEGMPREGLDAALVALVADEVPQRSTILLAPSRAGGGCGRG